MRTCGFVCAAVNPELSPRDYGVQRGDNSSTPPVPRAGKVLNRRCEEISLDSFPTKLTSFRDFPFFVGFFFIHISAVTIVFAK